MPHLRHHRRRHSWPYCGPIPRPERQYVATNINQAPNPYPSPLNHPQFMAPLISADLHEQDDAVSAGIVRPKTSRAHRLWSTSKDPVTNTSEPHRTASLRQIVRPPLDKARSLFVLPTATTTATVAAPTGGNAISYLMPSPSPSPRSLALPVQQPVLSIDNRGRMLNRLLPEERRHRRCHSERPRSWRQPSASLWTLMEE